MMTNGNKRMIEPLLVQHGSPTLAGMKTGSMFSCPCSSQAELANEIRSLNKRLVPKGLCILPLRYSGSRALVYLYRRNALKRDLTNQSVISLLRERGYANMQMECCICHLIHRFQVDTEFPHEVGVFLGYPPEDVCGFIQNHACGQACTGCWKVYGNETAAKKTFAAYKQCTKSYCRQWERGQSIERLAVAG